MDLSIASLVFDDPDALRGCHCRNSGLLNPLSQHFKGCAMNQHQLETSRLVLMYLQAKKESNRSPSHLAGIRHSLLWLQSLFPLLPTDPYALRHAIWQRWGHLSDESLASNHSRLLSFYRWLVKQDMLDPANDPFQYLERPRIKPKVPRVFNPDELWRLFDAARQPFERALVLVLLDTGCRVGELSGLEKVDILENGLRLASGKTGQRVVPVSQSVITYLRQLPSPWVFLKRTRGGRRDFTESPAESKDLQGTFRRIAIRAGLTGRGIGAHTMRHTFGTRWIDNGGDILTLSRVLGHSTLRTTQKYVVISSELLSRSHEKYGALVNLDLPGFHLSKEPPFKIELPPEVAREPLSRNGEFVSLFFSEWRRAHLVKYRIRARIDGRRSKDWRIYTIGTSLPFWAKDVYRSLILEENERRRLAFSQGAHFATLFDRQEIVDPAKYVEQLDALGTRVLLSKEYGPPLIEASQHLLKLVTGQTLPFIRYAGLVVSAVSDDPGTPNYASARAACESLWSAVLKARIGTKSIESVV